MKSLSSCANAPPVISRFLACSCLRNYLALAGEVLVNAGPGDQANDSDQGDLESARGETYIHFNRKEYGFLLGQSSDVYSA